RDELWFIEFGRGAALPLTPEEAPTDGEPVVPCAQGRIVIETSHPAPPHFATCLTYRHAIAIPSTETPPTISPKLFQTANESSAGSTADPSYVSQLMSRGAVAKGLYHRQHSINQPQSPAIRPEDLRVTPWFSTTANTTTTTIDDSITDSTQGLDRPFDQTSSYPSSSSFSRNNDKYYPSLSARPDLYSTRGSSIDSDSVPIKIISSAPRKAYMDLSDAIALLDETCPNPDASPSLTPRTPRTPLNLNNSRNKRARSKSSDNSSNYSNERLSDRSSTTDSCKEKRRPFLQKIGISKTEDRPFLSKIAPRIIGKPYLEKIGPSKAVERPFLDKIGSSKTLDKFNFEALRDLPRAMIRRTQTIVEPSIERTREEPSRDVILVVEEEEVEEPQLNNISIDRKRSGKGLLLKMYSFETEDLDDNASIINDTRDPLRAASLDNVIDAGPRSLPSLDDNTCSKIISSSKDTACSKLQSTFIDGAELVKCRVTTSGEIVSSSSAANVCGAGGSASGSIGYLGSPRAAASLSNSPRWPVIRHDKPSSSVQSRTLDRNYSSRDMSISDEEAALIVPNSPTKRRISKVSPEPQLPVKIVPAKGKNSSLPRDLDESPTKTRRQASEDILPDANQTKNDPEFENLSRVKLLDDKTRSAELIITSKTRRQTFNDAIEKFGGSDFGSRTATTRRQISEDILDKTDKKDYRHLNDERRGISSDNLIYSRETVVGSAPSASSLGYQSGSDSPFPNSQPSSNNSQDMLRGTFKLLHDKFELQDVPAESYAAFKRRTRTTTTIAGTATTVTEFPIATERFKFVAKETTIGPIVQVGKVYEIKNNKTSKVVVNKNENQAKEITDKHDSKELLCSSTSATTTTTTSTTATAKSVLKKQERIDNTNDQEADVAGSLRKPMRRIFHEPSQETMDLLTELKRIKSLLKTPSEEGKDWELDCLRPARLPKKISLSDKEFCLSVDRENSIRRPSVLRIDNKEKKTEIEEEEHKDKDKDRDRDRGGNEVVIDDNNKEGCIITSVAEHPCGPALFEKRCLSLDYADDVKPIKPDVRAISLASARTPRSATDETIDSFYPDNIIYDSKNCLSDVFTSSPPPGESKSRTSPSSSPVGVNSEISNKVCKSDDREMGKNCLDVDIAIPVDQTGSVSPKRGDKIQGRTSDLYEIISPRSTPFRVKKRLGRISVEDGVKPESFTIDKVDCRSVVTQKKTKCFPL
ncbi:uncharacterized protein LOC106693398, partial [Microplitis demolitor]|uniref:uncharacterized protein LOC106693398 n=1 Tax=Microplitis demolitor TaxID=69319 RepID=UPI00235B6316